MINILSKIKRKLSSQELAELYEAHHKYIYNVCYRFMKEKSLSQDALHETFFKVHKNWHQLKNPKAVRGWIRQIAVNHCLQQLKKAKKFEALSGQTQAEPLKKVGKSISFREINAEICQLPEGCRKVFVLFLLEGYSHKEIAKMLNVSESTSKTQYKRAKELLQEKLKFIWNEAEEF